MANKKRDLAFCQGTPISDNEGNTRTNRRRCGRSGHDGPCWSPEEGAAKCDFVVPGRCFQEPQIALPVRLEDRLQKTAGLQNRWSVEGVLAGRVMYSGLPLPMAQRV